MTTFPELRDIGEFLGSRSAILDGEIVALDKDGRPSFATLAHRLHLTSKISDRASGQVKSRRASSPSTCCTSRAAPPRRHLRRASRGPRVAETSRRDLRHASVGRPTCTARRSLASRRSADWKASSRSVATSLLPPGHPQRRLDQGQELPHPRGRHRRMDGRARGARGQPRRAPARHTTDEGFTYVGKVGTGFSAASRRELLIDSLPLARKTTPFSERLSPSRDRARPLCSPAVRGRGAVRRVDARRAPSTSVVARTANRQERE